MYECIDNLGQIPPDEAFRLGRQTDSLRDGHYYPVIANTPHGRIPGKGRQGHGWYGYGGKEHPTQSFQFLRSSPGAIVTLQRSSFPPVGAVTGYQSDTGTMYSVICHHTHHGKIPGKSDGNRAWFCWGGKEEPTQDFSYVVVSAPGGAGPPVPVPGFNPSPAYDPRPPVPVPGFNPGGYPPQPYNPGYPPQPQPGYPPQPYPPAGGYAPGPGQGPPAQGLAEGMTVRFRCKTGKNLRITKQSVVDGNGGTGTWATFQVHVFGPGQYGFVNQVQQWLAIKHGSVTQTPLYNDPDASFLLHLNPDSSVSLESYTHRGQHVGVKRRHGHSKLTRAHKPSSKLYIEVVY